MTQRIQGFAVWITGLPAAGKSTLAAALVHALADRGVGAEWLESDAVRRILTPRPTYTDDERAVFYGALVWVAGLLAGRGVPVVLDATGHRRLYRDAAREALPRFLEVFLDTPVELCRARDPKGLWRAAEQGQAATLPGSGVSYEAPERPDVWIHGGVETPEDAAARIVARLVAHGWVS